MTLLSLSLSLGVTFVGDFMTIVHYLKKRLSIKTKKNLINFVLFLCLTLPITTNATIINVATVAEGLRGSGFIIANAQNTSLVITNAHICIQNYDDVVFHWKNPKVFKDLLVLISQEGQKKAKIIAIDLEEDLCLLRIAGNYKPLPLSSSSELTYNQFLLVASPLPYKRVNSVYQEPDKSTDAYADFHRHSYIIKGSYEFGQSGSAVLDKDGDIIGVFWGIEKKDNRYGYVIGLEALKEFLNAYL